MCTLFCVFGHGICVVICSVSAEFTKLFYLFELILNEENMSMFLLIEFIEFVENPQFLNVLFKSICKFLKTFIIQKIKC